MCHRSDRQLLFPRACVTNAVTAQVVVLTVHHSLSMACAALESSAHGMAIVAYNEPMPISHILNVAHHDKTTK